MWRKKNPKAKALTLPAIDETQAVYLDYLFAANVVIRSTMARVRADLVPVVIAERNAYQARDDAGDNARAVIERLRQQMGGDIATASERIAAATRLEAQRHTKRWTAIVEARANVNVADLVFDDDLTDMLSLRVGTTVSLVKNIGEQMQHRIERSVLGGILEGKSNREVAKELSKLEGFSRARAKLVARDQASKLNGAITELRHEQAGVTHYRWKTVVDGRERTTHRENNRKVFAWKRPPSATGHPGSEINCRCKALAFITDDPEDEAFEELASADPDFLDLEKQTPLARSVGSTLSQDIFGWSGDQKTLALAEARELETVLAEMKAAKSFSESDAEAMFAALFGFDPDDRLPEMAGTRTNFLKSRRAQLFAAMNVKTETIAEALESALGQ